MIYKSFPEKYFLRFERGDDFLTELSRFAAETRVTLGNFSALGSFDGCELGFFNPKTKNYSKKQFNNTHEVVSLEGNLSLFEGKPFFHTHVAITDQEFNAYGGHLFAAKVGATLEVVFEKISGELERKFNDEIGLKLLDG